MEINKTSNRIHPLVAAAAVSVMLVSLIGVAAITGVIPSSHSTVSPAGELSVAPAAPASASAPDAKLAANEVAVPAKPAVPAQKSHKTVTRSAAPANSQQPTQVAQAPAICSNCGVVESVQAIQHQAKPSGVGVVAGGVIGGLLGNQVGGGNGRTLATVAGAVGGGYAGNEIEKRTHTTTSYQVKVRMEDGMLRSFPQPRPDGWRAGDRVKVVNGALTLQG